MEENVKILDADKKHENPPNILSYVRRLDRTPEKDFHLKCDEDKKIICQKRTLVLKVKDKIDRLENEVEQREKEVESEKELRKQAEQKLQTCLQDMYNNKDVNEELRQRLPRANKSDPFKPADVEAPDTDLSEIEEQIVLEEEAHQTASKPRSGKDKSSRSPHQSTKHTANSSQSSPQSSPTSARRQLNFTEEADPQCFAESQLGMERPPNFLYSNMNMSSPLRGYYGHSIGANPPYMPYGSGQWHPGGLNYPNHLMHSNSPYPQTHRPTPSPALHSGGLSAHDQTLSQSHPNLSTTEHSPSSSATSSLTSSPTSTTSTAESPSTKTTTATLSGPHRAQRLLHTSPDSGIGASTGYMGRSFTSPLRPGTSALPDPFIPSVSPRLQGATGGYGYDQNKHINSLLTEIDAQKTETKKLQSELASKDTEIETLKLTLKTQGMEKNANSEMQQAAGIIEEVYAAQKKRDEATAGRMKLANDERDDVMMRLRQLEARLDAQSGGTSFMEHPDDDLKLDLENLDSNEDMYLLMSRLDSPATGDNDVSAFVQRAEAMRQRQREVTSEEMQIVIEQRDMALAKCRKLEEELLRYQKDRDRDADGGMDKSVTAKLAALQQERDLAVAKSQQLDNEVQTLRLYYGLHKSLVSENSYKQQANDTIHSYQEELKATRCELQTAQKENSRLVSQVRSTTIDKKQLEQALESVSQDKERLQRLAGVLKKKLNQTDKQAGDTEQH